MAKIRQKTHTAVLLLVICLFLCACLLIGHIGQGLANRGFRAAFESTEPERIAPKIIIDAGHGGEDGGAVAVNGALEKDLNLFVALTLEQMLTGLGCDVIMTRSSDVLLYDRNSDFEGHKKQQDLASRLSIAKNTPDAIFVSIHMNSFVQAEYSGLQVYYSQNDPSSIELAELVQSKVRTELQPYNNRKIKAADKGIFLLDRAPGCAVLIECGFLSNAADAERLCSEDFRRSLCFAISGAIVEFVREKEI